jgi:hypothetical protein
MSPERYEELLKDKPVRLQTEGELIYVIFPNGDRVYLSGPIVIGAATPGELGYDEEGAKKNVTEISIACRIM